MKNYYFSYSHRSPDEDESQDIKVLEIGHRDGVTFMKFLKKFNSDDKEVSHMISG